MAFLLAPCPAFAADVAPHECARVVVAAHPLPRGHVITPDDTASAPDSAAGRVPCPVSRVPVVGSTTRRSLAAGEPLTPPAVAPPELVRRGEPVSATYADGGITLTVGGTAMNAAPLGGKVLVRVDARRRLAGVADGPAHVRIVADTPAAGASSAAAP